MKNPGRRVFPWWVVVFCLMISCARPVPEPKLDVDAARFSRLRQQGDAEFARMHWCGWKNAAGYFREALTIKEEPELRQSLFTTCILLSLRETELAFHDESWVKMAEELLPMVPAQPFSAYLSLAKGKLLLLAMRLGGLIGHGGTQLMSDLLPRETAMAVPHYMYVMYLFHLLQFSSDKDGKKLIGEKKEFHRLHGNSNLAVFLRLWTPQEIDEKLAAFPDFAEMYKLLGDWHNSGKKYQAALDDYQRALEAMPVLYKASNAMGTLCYSLEEYEQALLHYGRTLAIDPLEPSALFGRAICLSELERYDESDQVLNEMIEKQSFYHGEANYYLAKNCYYRQRWADARSFLNLAAAYIPDSPEMNMLSGLLHFDQGETDRAALDFRKVLEQQTDSAEAWFFLGQIAQQEKKFKEARLNFQKAVENFRRDLKIFDTKLEEMKKEEGSDSYKLNYYLKRLRKRSEYAREAVERLAPLKNIFRKPPLLGLRELLTDLAVSPTGK